MRNFRRWVAGLAAIIVAGAVLTACSSHTTYASGPPAYGESGRCYFVDDPGEVYALQQAGRCPRNWSAAPMPASWRSSYAYYYDSPSYYDSYVPQARRSTYVRTVKTYEKTNRGAVLKAPTVTPQKKSGSQFGGGNGRTGGDYTSSRTSPQPRRQSTSTGTSTRKSGSSFGGGSRGARK